MFRCAQKTRVFLFLDGVFLSMSPVARHLSVCLESRHSIVSLSVCVQASVCQPDFRNTRLSNTRFEDPQCAFGDLRIPCPTLLWTDVQAPFLGTSLVLLKLCVLLPASWPIGMRQGAWGANLSFRVTSEYYYAK